MERKKKWNTKAKANVIKRMNKTMMIQKQKIQKMK